MKTIAEKIDVSFNEHSIQTSRVVGEIGVPGSGNTVLLLSGVHGNEPLGILAVQRVFNQITVQNIKVKGYARAIVGNMEANRLGQRFLHKDLNRLWTRHNLDDLHYNKLDLHHTEYREMRQVYDILQEMLAENKGEFFVLDLHTTSSATIPFIVTNRVDKCAAYVDLFPMPSISGLTGFLDGTFLSYINELGHVGLAYEAGQHQSPISLNRFESFIWLSLMNAGLLPEVDDSFRQFHYESLVEELTTRNKSFKIISRYHISEGEEFAMLPGFTNFQKINAGDLLAQNKNGPIISPYDGFIFMPLYQSQGDDGFFIIVPSEAEKY
jgi:succinylglutamate desuccinylase